MDRLTISATPLAIQVLYPNRLLHTSRTMLSLGVLLMPRWTGTTDNLSPRRKTEMKYSQVINAALAGGAALIMMAASASAATITYSTDAAGTGFNGSTSLVLNSSSGAAATLTYVPVSNIASGVPSNVSYGNFNLVCSSCSTQAINAGSFFDPFTFQLIITDQTDVATGTIVGTSTGGLVWSDVSQITVNWAPLQLGPGTDNATSGDFGGTTFSTTVFTGIVAPNSGSIPGQSTVQGYIDSTAVVPEPSTLGIIGGGLLGLSLLRRKVRASK